MLKQNIPLGELKADPALAIAFGAAALAARLLTGDTQHDRIDWPMLHDAKPTPDGAAWAAARDTLAPFVRQNREAPAEAIYIHAQHAGLHKGPAWSGLSHGHRLAYEIFGQVLQRADAAIVPAVKAAAPRAPVPIPRDERALTQLDEPLAIDRSMLAKPRAAAKPKTAAARSKPAAQPKAKPKSKK